MRLPDGHRFYTVPCGIRTKWPSGTCTPLYHFPCLSFTQSWKIEPVWSVEPLLTFINLWVKDWNSHRHNKDKFFSILIHLSNIMDVHFESVFFHIDNEWYAEFCRVPFLDSTKFPWLNGATLTRYRFNGDWVILNARKKPRLLIFWIIPSCKINRHHKCHIYLFDTWWGFQNR